MPTTSGQSPPQGTETLDSTSQHRSRHRLTRSITDSSHPAKHRHHHSLHRRDRDDKVPQSAGPKLQPIAAIDFTRSEGATPDISQNPSRRTSIFESVADGSEPSTRDRADIKDEKEKASLRASELDRTLEQLHSLSHGETRRLDNTYYSILEKLVALQNTIASLKDLSIAAKQLNSDFNEGTKQIVVDVEEQLSQFEQGLNVKQKRAEKLVARIDNGRAKTQALNDRMRAVKNKIGSWEAAEQDWQEKTRRRLRILWVLISVTVLVLVVLLIFEFSPVRVSGPVTPRLKSIDNLTEVIPSVERLENATLGLKKSIAEALGGRGDMREDERDDDSPLRAFDEL